jgi:hypothetical protein
MRLTCCVLATLLGASACIGQASKGQTEEDRRRGAAQEMLERRARRLAARDLNGYLAPLSPEARVVEEPIARGALAVPLATIELVLGPAVSEPGRLRSAKVEFVYRYQGLPDDNPFRLGFIYDLEQRDRSWSVASAKLDPQVVPPIWATGPVQVAHSPHFLVLHRPGLGRVAVATSLAEQARAQLGSRLTLQADERHLLLLAGGASEVAALVGPPGEAIAYARSTVLGDPPRPAGRDMIVNLSRALGPARARVHGRAEEPEVSPVKVFQHELAHLALFRFTGASTPDWVVEGAAMYLADERRAQSWAAYVRGRLLDAPEFSLANLDRQADLAAVQYPYANAAALHLVERAGPATFFEFYRSFQDADFNDGDRQSPGPDHDPEVTNRLLRRYYQLDLGELERQVDGWIRAVVARR